MSDSTYDLSQCEGWIEAGVLTLQVLSTQLAQAGITSVATNAIGTAEIVYTAVTGLLPPNLNRKGLIIQNPDAPVNVWLGATAVPTYQLSKNSILEIERYIGAVSAETVTGSTTVFVTEKT